MRLVTAILVMLAVLGWVTLNSSGTPSAVAPSDDIEKPNAAFVLRPEASNAGMASITPPQTDPPIVRFPNGNSYQISLKARPEQKIRRGPSLADDFEDLRESAMSGNGEAASALYHLLSACDDAYLDSKELEAVIDRMYQTRVRPHGPGAAHDNVETVPDEWLYPYEKHLRQQFKTCGSFADEQIKESRQWLKLAAEIGHDDSLMEYANLIMYESVDSNGRPNYPRESISVLERAWMRGNVHALHELYQVLHYGSESIPRDHVKAHAFLYLNTHLRVLQIERGKKAPAGYDGKGLISAKLAFLRQSMMRLNPSEIDESMALAEKIMQENPQCCFDYF